MDEESVNPDDYLTIVCAVCPEANDPMILTADVVTNLMAMKESIINGAQTGDDEEDDENDGNSDAGNSDKLLAQDQQKQFEAVSRNNSIDNESGRSNEHVINAVI